MAAGGGWLQGVGGNRAVCIFLLLLFHTQTKTDPGEGDLGVHLSLGPARRRRRVASRGPSQCLECI